MALEIGLTALSLMFKLAKAIKEAQTDVLFIMEKVDDADSLAKLVEMNVQRIDRDSVPENIYNEINKRKSNAMRMTRKLRMKYQPLLPLFSALGGNATIIKVQASMLKRSVDGGSMALNTLCVMLTRHLNRMEDEMKLKILDGLKEAGRDIRRYRELNLVEMCKMLRKADDGVKLTFNNAMNVFQTVVSGGDPSSLLSPGHITAMLESGASAVLDKVAEVGAVVKDQALEVADQAVEALDEATVKAQKTALIAKKKAEAAAAAAAKKAEAVAAAAARKAEKEALKQRAQSKSSRDKSIMDVSDEEEEEEEEEVGDSLKLKTLYPVDEEVQGALLVQKMMRGKMARREVAEKKAMLNRQNSLKTKRDNAIQRSKLNKSSSMSTINIPRNTHSESHLPSLEDKVQEQDESQIILHSASAVEGVTAAAVASNDAEWTPAQLAQKLLQEQQAEIAKFKDSFKAMMAEKQQEFDYEVSEMAAEIVEERKAQMQALKDQHIAMLQEKVETVKASLPSLGGLTSVLPEGISVFDLLTNERPEKLKTDVDYLADVGVNFWTLEAKVFMCAKAAMIVDEIQYFIVEVRQMNTNAKIDDDEEDAFNPDDGMYAQPPDVAKRSGKKAKPAAQSSTKRSSLLDQGMDLIVQRISRGGTLKQLSEEDIRQLLGKTGTTAMFNVLRRYIMKGVRNADEKHIDTVKFTRYLKIVCKNNLGLALASMCMCLLDRLAYDDFPPMITKAIEAIESLVQPLLNYATSLGLMIAIEEIRDLEKENPAEIAALIQEEEESAMENRLHLITTFADDLKESFEQGFAPDPSMMLALAVEVSSNFVGMGPTTKRRFAILKSVMGAITVERDRFRVESVDAALKNELVVIQSLPQRQDHVGSSSAAAATAEMVEMKEKQASMAEQTNMMMKLLQEQKHSFDVRNMLGENTEPSKFWTSSFGKETYEVMWLRFRTAFLTFYGKKSERVLNKLRPLLVDFRGIVTVDSIVSVTNTQGQFSALVEAAAAVDASPTNAGLAGLKNKKSMGNIKTSGVTPTNASRLKRGNTSKKITPKNSKSSNQFFGSNDSYDKDVAFTPETVDKLMQQGAISREDASRFVAKRMPK